MKIRGVSGPSSFFDGYDGSDQFKFVKPELHHKDHLSLQPITKTQITFCKNVNTAFTLEGTFKLQGHLLAYYPEGTEHTALRVLDLLFARVKVWETNLLTAKYMLEFTKNGISYELYFNNENIIEYWLDSLKPICVFTKLETYYIPIHYFEDNYSFSSTYVGRHKTTLELFALKRFKKDFTHDPDLKTIFLNQIALMKYFNSHPNLAKLHEIYETTSAVYLVKQYDPNETLEFLLRKSSLLFSSFEYQTAKIIEKILEALAFIASEAAFLHSLSLNNVIIDKEGQVKIVDFTFLTQANMSKLFDQDYLSPGYTAPEAFTYDKTIAKTTFDDRSNVFSVGCILFEMLFGFPLFFEQNPSNTLSQNKSFCFASTSDFILKEINNPECQINKQGLQLLLKLLEPDFKKRITAVEALNHPYFKMENYPVYNIPKTNDMFLFTLNKVRTSNEPVSSLAVGSKQGSTNETWALNGAETFGPSSPDRNIIDTEIPSLIQRRKKANSEALKPSIEIPTLDFKGRTRTRKCVSFLDPATGQKTIQANEAEDTGELDESDEESEYTNIKAFLGSHNIQISLKNPGK